MKQMCPNRDREGASLGTQANKRSSVTASFLCLAAAAAAAAGADCNGSARGNGVQSFCVWPRRVLLLLPLPAQMQSIQTHSHRNHSDVLGCYNFVECRDIGFQ